MASRQARLIVLAIVALAFAWALDARQPARRIVSLVPAVTEMLFAIGAGPNVVAVSSYDRFPAEVTRLPKVGALLDPDVERILSLRPDLVIVYGSQHDLKSRLARTTIDVFEYRHGGLSDIGATMRKLGGITGQEKQSEQAARDLERRLEAIRTRVAGRRPVPTLLVFGREPLSLRNLYASGSVGFLHDVLELAGGRNVLRDTSRESVQVSTEGLLGFSPEAIVELRPGEAPAQDQRQRERDVWQALQAVPAVKAGRIHILYGDHLVVAGPRVGLAAEQIARALHP